jgi:hypothetical protein
MYLGGRSASERSGALLLIPPVMVMDMKPKQRAKAIADQLDKSDKHRWPALIEAAIRDTENGIIARLSETLESQSDPMSPSSAAAIVR